AHLAASAGIEVNGQAIPGSIDLADASGNAAWPLSKVFRENAMTVVEGLESRLPRVPRGPWSDPPKSAAIVPVPSSKPHDVRGFLVLGVSARLAFNADYRTFFQLIASHLATAIANAEAYDEERKRAEALAELDRA